MKRWLIFTVLFSLVFSVGAALSAPAEKSAAKNTLRGKHLEQALACADCHGTKNPKAAAKQEKCRGCHGDMLDADWIIFVDRNGKKTEHSPHDAHEPTADCTLCHSIHKPSRLDCNKKCHGFTNEVP